MTPDLALVLLIPAWNNLLHMVPERFRNASTNAGVTAAGVAALVWIVANAEWLLGSGVRFVLRYGPWAAGAALVLVAVFKAVPRVTRPMAEPRIARMSNTEFVLHTALRIPITTALTEELLFRGLMWIVVDSFAGPVWALVGTSVGFAAWHVVVSWHQGRHRTHTGWWVAGSVVATFAAGLGFGWLRMVSGGVWAPVLAHLLINLVGALGARMGSTGEPIEA